MKIYFIYAPKSEQAKTLLKSSGFDTVSPVNPSSGSHDIRCSEEATSDSAIQRLAGKIIPAPLTHNLHVKYSGFANTKENLHTKAIIAL